MTNQKSVFWIAVDEAEAEVKAEIAKIERQPRDGSVYITSLKVRTGDPASKAGVVSLAPVRLAAQRVAEQTHAVSTTKEIDQYLVLHEQRRQEILAGGPSKNTMVFQQQPKEAKL
jgi:hypothetical protein